MVVLKFFLNLDASVLLPMIIFVFAIILRTPLAQAFRSSLIVGIGFIGLNLIIDLLTDSLGPAATTMVQNFGLQLKVIDIGWPATAAISYGTVLGSLAIPIGIGVNILLLSTGLTRTLNVDIWNYWHCAFTGSLVYGVSGDFFLGIFTMIVHVLFIFFCADLMAKDVERFYGFQHITFPHAASAPSYLFAKPLNKLFDRLPIIKNMNINEKTLKNKFGIFGDPMVIGAGIGLIIGGLARYELEDIFLLSVQTGAVIYLMPKMVALLMEGLIPISEAASEFMKKKYKNKQIYIGMDSALSVGHASVLSVSMVLIPIALILSIILPGNQVLPFGDLATIPFLVCLMVPVFRGNLIRTLIAGSIYISIGLYIATWVSPFFTSAAKAADFDFGAFTNISSLVDGAVWTTFILIGSAKFMGWFGLGMLGILMVIAIVLFKKRAKTS